MRIPLLMMSDIVSSYNSPVTMHTHTHTPLHPHSLLGEGQSRSGVKVCQVTKTKAPPDLPLNSMAEERVCNFKNICVLLRLKQHLIQDTNQHTKDRIGHPLGV